MTTELRSRGTPRLHIRSRASSVTVITWSAKRALTRSSSRISCTAAPSGRRPNFVVNSSGKVSCALRITGVPRSFGTSAVSVRKSGMLCASTRSSPDRESMVIRRAARAKKTAYAPA